MGPGDVYSILRTEFQALFTSSPRESNLQKHSTFTTIWDVNSKQREIPAPCQPCATFLPFEPCTQGDPSTPRPRTVLAAGAAAGWAAPGTAEARPRSELQEAPPGTQQCSGMSWWPWPLPPSASQSQATAQIPQSHLSSSAPRRRSYRNVKTCVLREQGFWGEAGHKSSKAKAEEARTVSNCRTHTSLQVFFPLTLAVFSSLLTALCRRSGHISATLCLWLAGHRVSLADG